MKNLIILGSTGSIGRQTLNIVDWYEDFRVAALTAGSNIELLAEQARKYQPQIIVIADESKYLQLKELLPDFSGQIAAGREGLQLAAAWDSGDMVIAGISGIAGLEPVWTAIEAGKDIAFANKEVLVAAGQAVMALVKEKNVAFLPVDSEHSAIFQCLEQDKSSVESLILTASGGPFVDFSQEQLAEVKAAAALCHPTWQMGSKVTIDSATMMNKGLEVMEAHWLFNIPYDKIQILVHQESIVHSLVQYGDGSLLAHLGPHDMRIPIQYALTYPRRRQNKLEKLDLAQVGSLHFRQPDFIKFPCLGLAYEAGIMGGTLPAVLNAANEELVGAFLKGEIGFLDIPRYIEKTLHRHELKPAKKLAAVLEADAWARAVVRKDYLRR